MKKIFLLFIILTCCTVFAQQVNKLPELPGTTRAPVYFLSQNGAISVADLSEGYVVFGTDNTTAIQNVLDKAQSDSINEFRGNNIGKIKTVLILGNSIVLHPPKPEIGWYGDWGMAASVRDSDFVHLLIRDIHQIDPSVVVKFKSTGDFERDYVSYPLSNLDSLRNPDMLILKISENVNGKKALEDNFISYYDKLVKYIAPNGLKVIVDGFLDNKNVNRLIEEYALKNNYPFVTTSSLSKDTTNTAKGKFAHVGVAAHPSDKGMRMIEQRIWDGIKDYFNNK